MYDMYIYTHMYISNIYIYITSLYKITLSMPGQRDCREKIFVGKTIRDSQHELSSSCRNNIVAEDCISE